MKMESYISSISHDLLPIRLIPPPSPADPTLRGPQVCPLPPPQPLLSQTTALNAHPHPALVPRLSPSNLLKNQSPNYALNNSSNFGNRTGLARVPRSALGPGQPQIPQDLPCPAVWVAQPSGGTQHPPPSHPQKPASPWHLN